jgi:hypothetical protein
MAAKPRQNWGAGVQFVQPLLASLVFEAGPDADLPEEIGEVEGNFILNVTRLSSTEIAVEFGLDVDGIPEISARCTFRAKYRLRPNSPEEQNPEEALKGVATKLAPAMLYPFVREALQRSAVQAGLPAFLVPIVTFASMFDDFELPVTPPSAADGS